MAISEKILNELKEKLLSEKKQLEESLGKIARPVNVAEGDYETKFDELGSDRDDNATEVEQYADNLSVEVSLEKRLQEIIEALERIEKGTYGFCDNCQQEIDIERLRANPAASTCIKCS
jgi:DnaK suppressor protein